MTEQSANIIAVAWRVVITALVVLGRLALDRLSVRGQTRRVRRRVR